MRKCMHHIQRVVGALTKKMVKMNLWYYELAFQRSEVGLSSNLGKNCVWSSNLKELPHRFAKVLDIGIGWTKNTNSLVLVLIFLYVEPQ